MEILCTIISMKGAEDLVIFNRKYTEKQLREMLKPLGSEEWVEDLLKTGKYLMKDPISFKFTSKGQVTTLTTEKSYVPYDKRDVVTIYPDGRTKLELKRKGLLERLFPVCDPRDLMFF